MRKKQIVAVFLLAFILNIGVAIAASTSATATIGVEGMHCDGCASSIEKKVKATEGVEEVRVSFPKKEVWVKFDDQKISVAKIREVINSTGFKALED